MAVCPPKPVTVSLPLCLRTETCASSCSKQAVLRKRTVCCGSVRAQGGSIGSRHCPPSWCPCAMGTAAAPSSAWECTGAVPTPKGQSAKTRHGQLASVSSCRPMSSVQPALALQGWLFGDAEGLAVLPEGLAHSSLCNANALRLQQPGLSTNPHFPDCTKSCLGAL